MRRIPFRLLTLLSAVLAITACILDQHSKGGSVVENEVLAGTIYTQDGQPAANAEVKVFPVDYVPNKALIKRAADTSIVFGFRTDAEGKYVVASVPPGEYNILGSSDGRVSFRDSVTITGSRKTLPSDTLGEPGSVTGFVALEPDHDPRNVFIQILGTNRFVNADSGGKFVLTGMAGGDYAMRIVTTLDNYPPYFGGFTLPAGGSLVMKDTIRLAFTGIPVAAGLRADYDTAGALARIAWSPVHYPFFKEYLVYRSEKSALTLPQNPIARVRDTFFVDSLAAFAQGAWPATGPLPAFEYRVRVRNLSDQEGLAFGDAVVTVAPIASVSTHLVIKMAGGRDGSLSIGDTARLVADWSNPTRSNDSLIWMSDPDKAVLRAVRAQGAEGRDTLRLALPASPGPVSVLIAARDGAGALWQTRFTVNVIQDPPAASAGRDTTVSPNDTVYLQGAASDLFGRIVKWEWNAGAGGAFIATSRPDTQIAAPGAAGTYRFILRATDDDGNWVVDTMAVRVLPDLPEANAGKDTSVTVSDTVFLHGVSKDQLGRIVLREWNIGPARGFVPVSTEIQR
jgi:hypothetical protein